ncbi:MAG: Mpv17/PMP22 family protein [Bacteroidota bacterium]|nr:Mpv17/PMP22 family protein [Bacteroidota bacterium]
MKKQDIIFIICILVFFIPFFLSEQVFQLYNSFNKEHGMVMSFFKFAVLATLGESIGLRIRNGVYNKKGFGLIPRAIVWGFLGLTIKMSFVIFATGTPQFLAYLGFEKAVEAMAGSLTPLKLLVAFSISAAMNLIYAPVMMTLHKITDTHILNNNGTIKGFFKPIKFGEIMVNMDWPVQWNFVFKKTIPFFWIPAHTITFLLPSHYQVLFAAVLGIVLGILLATASLKSEK